jgi:hypothetical protein
MTVRDIVNTELVLFFYGDVFMDDTNVHYWADSSYIIVSPKVAKMLKNADDGGVDPEFLKIKPEIIFGDIYNTVYAHFLPDRNHLGNARITSIE